MRSRPAPDLSPRATTIAPLRRAARSGGGLFASLLVAASLCAAPFSFAEEPPAEKEPGHAEHPVPAPRAPAPPVDERESAPTEDVTRGNLRSVQVNVNGLGENIVGDAANEPSMAIDPTNPQNIVIGWRQFDTIEDSFRQAGYAYSRDGGLSWTFPGVLDPGVFRSDPVLDTNSAGVFFYYSLSTTTNAEMFISRDAGVSWEGPIPAQGGDKNWVAVDDTGSEGDGHVYPIWNSQFTCCAQGTDYGRSVDEGQTYQGPWGTPIKPKWGTIALGPEGEVYMVGATLGQGAHVALRSDSLRDATALPPSFEISQQIDLGGVSTTGDPPNPGGLMGQVWVAVDRSSGPRRGHAYILGSVDPPGADPLDVHLVRSTDGGQTWSAPILVNDDGDPGAYQWFGSLDVAPDGRLDVVWNDTSRTGTPTISELTYAYSTDGGLSWSSGLPVSPPFDSTVGWPQQDKLGDYYQVVSELETAAVAYSATFNGEQDVYFLRVGDCNDNGLHDSRDLEAGTSADCDADGIPDECEADCNNNGVNDDCDLGAGEAQDCNANGVPDACDVLTAASEDCDADGRPDECVVTFDLESDQGFTVGAPTDTATTGIWERVDPIGTAAQPENDHTAEGVNAYVTGQGSPGGGVGENDVDEGTTTLTSPRLELAAFGDPRVAYWRWFSNDAGSSINQDVFAIDISNDDGASWVPLERVGPSGPDTSGGWLYASFRVADFLTPTNEVRLRFVAEDADPGSIVEAGIDDVSTLDCAACDAVAPTDPAGLTLTRVGADIARLEWAAASGAASYEVYRGSSPDASDLACVAEDVPALSWEDEGALPPPGGALFYALASSNCAGASPPGFTSGGTARVPATPCP